MPLPDCAPFGDCDYQKLSFEQKFNYLVEDDGNGCPRLKTASSGAATESEQVSQTTILNAISGKLEFETESISEIVSSGNAIISERLAPQNLDISTAIFAGSTAAVAYSLYDAWVNDPLNQTFRITQINTVAEVGTVSIIVTYIG